MVQLGSVQLVAATDHPQARILEDLVEEDEVEVAGHNEIIADSRLFQPGCQVGAGAALGGQVVRRTKAPPPRVALLTGTGRLTAML
jgi:hypothetical protein